jgi:predicted dienelactone hydrolase
LPICEVWLPRRFKSSKERKVKKLETAMSFRLAMITLLALFITPASAAERSEAGYEHVVTPDGTEVGIWFPASGTTTHQRLGLYAQDVVVGTKPEGKHPLIVMSHGTGGDFAGHVDTAIALARSGFIVAALTHPGDNWRDNSRATQIQDRPKALSNLITYMLANWPSHGTINPDRIGAFGFSAGGFTVLTAAGGKPDLLRLADHCRAHPDYFDCRLTKTQPRTAVSARPDIRDTRIKAIVVAAPALGFTFDRAGLAAVNMPVQLWRADDDQILPAPEYADAVKRALPKRPEFHTVPKAGHFDFLAPCETPLLPQLCKSAPHFDRTAFHAKFNANVVRFFKAKLKN